jgi:hypothetical protein
MVSLTLLAIAVLPYFGSCQDMAGIIAYAAWLIISYTCQLLSKAETQNVSPDDHAALCKPAQNFPRTVISGVRV